MAKPITTSWFEAFALSWIATVVAKAKTDNSNDILRIIVSSWFHIIPSPAPLGLVLFSARKEGRFSVFAGQCRRWQKRKFRDQAHHDRARTPTPYSLFQAQSGVQAVSEGL
jgi:hypothetical protein